ncbi:MAG: hypothetical protein CM1200mP13_15480 [Candidatus Pelagibacterales bacterium]|nr:MAG: hypothetical protein CM1200mP13_15480 [Pelagibacterales bacterium]
MGKNGVEKKEEISLDEKKKSQFMHSIDAVKKLWGAASVIDKIFPNKNEYSRAPKLNKF